MSNVAYGLRPRNSSAAIPAYAVRFRAGALVMYPIHSFGSEAQKDKWLPRLQSGNASAASVSPSHNLARIPRYAHPPVKRGHQYILNGEKCGLQRVARRRRRRLANVEDEKVAIPWSKKGARIQNLGMFTQMVAARFRHSASPSRLCPSPKKSSARRHRLARPAGCLNQARFGIGWAPRAAMACYDTALQYAKTRKQFANKP